MGVFSSVDADERKQTAAPGKKALSFLQYLIVNHTRNVSSEELIDRFWGEQSNDPANALKNMLFKTRNFLKSMFPGQENLIVTHPGCYGWNSDIRLELDSEQFEQICLETGRRSGEVYLETLLSAVSLYKGDFLAGNDSDWVLSLRRYYQTLYLDACKMVLPMLQERERWTEIIGICEQASGVDYGEDTFIVYQMQALIEMEHPERAVDTYKRYRETLWREFEIEPAEAVEQIYTLAMSLCQGILEKQDVLKLVTEEETDGRAFFCTFGMFRNIVALEKRHLIRSGGASTLVIVSLGKKSTPTTDARRLERILLESLRAGDPVARLDASTYILMLAGTTEENARLVTERLDRAFHRTYTHSRAHISFRMSKLEAEKHSHN